MVMPSPFPFKGPHIESRSKLYGNTQDIQRTPVSNCHVPWSSPYPNYNPIEYTAPILLETNKDGTPKHSWVHPQDIKEAQDKLGGIQSYYDIIFSEKDKRPLNPMGRTGVSGRGVLGKWGANLAIEGLMVRETPERSSLEIFLIYRNRDNMQALPGGMKEEDTLEDALIKEMKEEVGPEIANLLFQKEKEVIYHGYVDDPRNTDNAWMETTAFAIFFEATEHAKIPDTLNPTDTGEVNSEKNKWVPLKGLIEIPTKKVPEGRLFASHHMIINHLLASEPFKNRYAERYPEFFA